MKNEKPRILPIKNIIIENDRVKTFVFEYEMDFAPGQFVMTWIPGYDEKPFGIVSRKKGEFMITVAAVGESTKALHSMNVGDMVGFRGPFGSTFSLPEAGSIALIAGGYGMASLFNLSKEAREKGIEVHVFLGARTKAELLYLDWMKELGAVLHLSTDDGSEGYKGFNTDLFAEHVKGHPPTRTSSPPSQGGISESLLPEGGLAKDLPFEGSTSKGGGMLTKVYTVGPEIMEMKVADICYQNNIPFEVSLERYMKCGIGICGSCSVDPVGWRMCAEGPVIDGEKLKQITEFGKYHRTASGKVENYPWNKD